MLLVYTFVVFLVASVILFSSAIRKVAASLLEDTPEIIVQRTISGRHELIPMDYADRIATIRGVRKVVPRLWGYYYHMASQANYTIMVPDVDPPPEDSAVVGDGVLRTWGTMVDGNRLYFRAYSGEAVVLNVVGTFQSETDLVSADLILVAEPTFRRICGIPAGRATDLAVTIRNSRESPVIAEKISLMLPDTRPILREEIQRTYSAIFDWRSGYVIVLLSGAIAAFFIFAWDKATGLSAQEKTEIGILKAMGWDTADVLIMKTWEGAFISLSAYLLGVLLAYVHVFAGSAPLFEHALKGWAVLYPRFQLQPVVSPSLLAVLFFLTVLPYTFITIVPTWRVATTDPDLVMR